jgi:hypothetical protein
MERINLGYIGARGEHLSMEPFIRLGYGHWIAISSQPRCESQPDEGLKYWLDD